MFMAAAKASENEQSNFNDARLHRISPLTFQVLDDKTSSADIRTTVHKHAAVRVTLGGLPTGFNSSGFRTRLFHPDQESIPYFVVA